MNLFSSDGHKLLSSFLLPDSYNKLFSPLSLLSIFALLFSAFLYSFYEMEQKLRNQSRDEGSFYLSRKKV